MKFAETTVILLPEIWKGIQQITECGTTACYKCQLYQQESQSDRLYRCNSFVGFDVKLNFQNHQGKVPEEKCYSFLTVLNVLQEKSGGCTFWQN